MDDSSFSSAFLITLAVLYVTGDAKLGRPDLREAARAMWESCSHAQRCQGFSELHGRIHKEWMFVYSKLVRMLLAILEAYALAMMIFSVFVASAKPAYRDTHVWGIMIGLLALQCGSRGSQEAICRLDIPRQLMPMMAVGNVVMGFVSADPVFFISTRVLCSPLCIAAEWSREDALAGGETLVLIAMNELISCLFVAVVLLQGDFLFCKKELAAMDLERQVRQREVDMKEMEQFMLAARRLLNVMCDCCERLSHDWEILQPSQKALQLLHIPIDSEQIPGALPFLRHVCSEDHERLQSFMKASKESDAPSSLHFRMVTASNTTFDAQLFHVSVPSLLSHDPEHLIGITTQQPPEQMSDFQSIPENGLLDLFGGVSAVSQRATSKQVRSRGRRGSLSDVSSSSGSSSQPLVGPGWGLIPSAEQSLSEVDRVNLLVDLMTGVDGYAIRSASVSFKPSAPMDKIPRLYSWVKPKYQPDVEDWMQEHLNAWYHREQLEEKCLGVKFKIPGLGASFTAGELVMRHISESQVSEEDYRLQMHVEMRTLIPV